MSCSSEDMFKTEIGAYNFERKLSEAQAIPVVGPLIVSPFKALASLAMVVAGLAGVILFGTLGGISGNEKLLELGGRSFVILGLGMFSLAYSIINFFSLGIIGYNIEKTTDSK